MKSRALRVGLLLIAITAGAAAGYLFWDLEGRLTAERRSSQVLLNQTRALLATVADLRASQQAYVALGQGEAFWIERVTSQLPAADRQLLEFRRSLASEEGRATAAAAGNALENFQKLDARTREHLLAGEALAASDLIFSDGLDATTAASMQIDAALEQELQAREAVAEAWRGRQLLVLAAAASVVLLILPVLTLTGRGTEPKLSSIGSSAELEATAPSSAVREAPGPDLASAARLCTDLARVLEARELPNLLERTARLIDASGIIVWIADPTGRELRPAMAYGYSDLVVASIGGIQREAANATAAAYRTAEVRTVKSEAGANGAVVAPLITPGGCVGVLSAELRRGAEQNAASRALAAIFAAQLATLVPIPAEPPRNVAKASS